LPSCRWSINKSTERRKPPRCNHRIGRGRIRPGRHLDKLDLDPGEITKSAIAQYPQPLLSKYGNTVEGRWRIARRSARKSGIGAGEGRLFLIESELAPLPRSWRRRRSAFDASIGCRQRPGAAHRRDWRSLEWERRIHDRASLQRRRHFRRVASGHRQRASIRLSSSCRPTLARRRNRSARSPRRGTGPHHAGPQGHPRQSDRHQRAVFDEIDANVGGVWARSSGQARQLAATIRCSASRHLPQIACYATGI